jgi:putative transposase
MGTKINKAYKFRLYPKADQEVLLNKHFGCCRVVYNYGLEQKQTVCKETGKTRSRFDIQSDLPKLKTEKEWLKEVNSQALQYSLVCLEDAMEGFFKEKKGCPKFKSKWDKQSFTVPQGVKLTGNKLRIPKFRDGIKIKLHRHVEGKLCSATVSKTKSGEYFVSILTEQVLDINQKPLEKDTAIGIDLGLADFIITSEGVKIERKRFVKKEQKRVKHLQRKLSKQKKGSNSRNKTKKRIAILHERAANRRNDYIHKVTRRLINESQVNTYCLEDLNVKGMLKNHKLAGSVSDVGWCEFKRQMEYKATWSGKNILRIGRFEASSKTCGCCGYVNKELTLKDRVWKCVCGVEHDRDINAAKNILGFAFRNPKTIPEGLRESKRVETASL